MPENTTVVTVVARKRERKKERREGRKKKGERKGEAIEDQFRADSVARRVVYLWH